MTSYRWTPLEEKGPPQEAKRRSLLPSKLLLQHLGVAVLVSLVLVTVFAAAVAVKASGSAMMLRSSASLRIVHAPSVRLPRGSDGLIRF